MKLKDKKLTADDINKAIAAAYGDGPFFRRIADIASVLLNPKMRKIYFSYRATARQVRRVKAEKCPDYVMDSLKGREELNDVRIFGGVNYPKLAFTLATVLMLAFSIVYYLQQNEIIQDAQPDMANKQVPYRAQDKPASPADTDKPPEAISGAAMTAEATDGLKTQKSAVNESARSAQDMRGAVSTAAVGRPAVKTAAAKSPSVKTAQVKPASQKVARYLPKDELITRQVKQSLAFVAKVFQKTDSKLDRNNPFEIVDEQLNKSIKAVNELLNGGKDEN